MLPQQWLATGYGKAHSVCITAAGQFPGSHGFFAVLADYTLIVSRCKVCSIVRKQRVRLFDEGVPVLKKLIQSTLNKFGYRIVRHEALLQTGVSHLAYGLEPFLPLLKRYGFNPKHTIDVGANKGTWTRRTLQFFPEALYTLVEPQDHLRTYIQDLLAARSRLQNHLDQRWCCRLLGVTFFRRFLPRR